MTTIRFQLAISHDQYLQVYQGVKQSILVTADDGRKVEFPARSVQKFLTREGIHGYFEMQISAQNKFLGIKRLQ